MKKLSYILSLLLLKINCCWVALWNWHQFFLSLFNVYLYFKADENASNISSNILNFRCWTKCWMHLRAYKIYKKRKKKIKIVLDDVRWNLFSIKFFPNIFWFIQPNVHVGCLWVQFRPTFGFLSLRWVQNICGWVCFERFY